MSMSLLHCWSILPCHHHKVGEDKGERGACCQDKKEDEGAFSIIFITVVITSLSLHVKEGG